MRNSKGLPGRALLIAVLLATTAATAADAIEIPSSAAQAQLLDMLEREALYRRRVDWPATRTRLKDAQGDPAKVRTVLAEAIGRSSGGHGSWMTQQRQQQRVERFARENATAAARSESDATRARDPRIGQVLIEGYAADPGAPPQQLQQQNIQRAVRWQNIIREKDSTPRCGWIVDLRDNTGGNMWPMLLGVAPLLRTSAMGIEDVGSFETADGPVRWQTTASGVRMGEATRLDFGQPGYLPRQVGAPVAVLTGPRTASSGEATVLAFRGRAQTRSFGQPTAGVSTANVVRRLVDGSALVLTTSVMRDRNGNGDGRKIAPDQATVGDAATVAAAEAWLLAQPACKEG
ncbi:S41 family peptidase [Stenotrophomonas indicatrix]|uniref:S41 family peptidase n=1 Tax=Stenotrophomonas indicatrix TaxID=2045451 RepID=UPI001CBC6F35|nr:S41 family peptidase [Stenotrophomonas indicatrix]